jgi:peptidoglycan hydrolase CwlO-like protein
VPKAGSPDAYVSAKVAVILISVNLISLAVAQVTVRDVENTTETLLAEAKTTSHRLNTDQDTQTVGLAEAAEALAEALAAALRRAAAAMALAAALPTAMETAAVAASMRSPQPLQSALMLH